MSDDGGHVPRLPPRRSPFGALVARAVSDPEAVEALAAAYASLEPCGRERLIEAVLEDARGESVSPAVPLCSLLAVEEDPALARRIAAALEGMGGEGLSAGAGSRALWAGTAAEGTAVLIRPLFGPFVELMALAWAGPAVVGHLVAPLLEAGEATRSLAAMPRADRLSDAPFAWVVQGVADALWRHHRHHGALPSGIERFADIM